MKKTFGNLTGSKCRSVIEGFLDAHAAASPDVLLAVDFFFAASDKVSPHKRTRDVNVLAILEIGREGFHFGPKRFKPVDEFLAGQSFLSEKKAGTVLH
jgi:hypothetical protein